MRNIIIFFLFVLFSFESFSQDGTWASQAGGSGREFGRVIGLDNFGNLFLNGSSYNSDCYFNTDTISVPWNDKTLFFAKYDAEGNEIWIKEVSGPSEEERPVVIRGIMSNDKNAFYLLAHHNGYIFIGDSLIMDHGGLVLSKMNLDGEIVWIRKVYYSHKLFSLACDDADNIYIMGSSEYQADFGDTAIGNGGYIAKYSTDGNFLWAKRKFRFHGPDVPEVLSYSAEFHNGNLFLSGDIINDTIIVDDQIIINQSYPPNYWYNSTFIASFSDAGDLNWMSTTAGPNAKGVLTLAVDNSDNSFIGGLFNGECYFGNDTIICSGEQGGFYAKFDDHGNYIWVKQLSSPSVSWMYFVVPDNANGFLFGCTFMDYCVLDSDTIMATSNEDMMVVHCDNDGNVIGYNQYPSGSIDAACSDQSGNIYISGSFNDVLSISNNTFTTRGGDDMFVAKILPITGIKKQGSIANSLLIYANPNEGICTIDLPDDFRSARHLTLSIFNNQGKLIQTAEIDNYEEQISVDIHAEAKGIYNVVLSDGKKRYTGKILFR